MKIGNNEIQKIYVGSVEITKAYAGSDLVYENTPTPTGYTLPDVSYLCNYNAVDFDDDTQTFFRSENTQLYDRDLTRNFGSGTLALDGRKVNISSNWGSKTTYANASGNPFNINSTNQDLTVIYKAAPTSGQYDANNNIMANRGDTNTYNWMVRVISFHNSVGEQMQFTPSQSPQTIVIRVHNGDGERKCIETNQIATQTGMDFSRQSAGVAFFAGWAASNLIEPFKGDFYWLYVSREYLTDAQVQQVIDYNEHKEHIEPTPIDYTKEYFTIKALSGGTITWAPTDTVEYSVNEGTWNTWDNTNGLAVSTNDEVRFRSTANTSYSDKNISSTGNFEVYGNSMSLFYGDNFVSATTFPTNNGSDFQNLFSGNTKVVSANNLILPATALKINCYNGMFKGCIGLITTPTLSATTLAQNCYISMFKGCTSLTTAPSLPATNLATSCYASMFEGCTSLTTAPELPATSMSLSGYRSMFQGCTSLTTAPTISATSMMASACTSMFEGCTSLTTVQATLPATTIAQNCYNSMFKGCTSLTTAPALPGTQGSLSCYQSMFEGCTSLTTPPTISLAITGTRCCNSMFKGCTALTTAPALSATYMSQGCYASMFQGCTALTTAPALPASGFAGPDCYWSMFQGCTSLTTAPTLSASNSITNNCYKSMFQGCTSLTTVQATLPATTIGSESYSSMFQGCTSLTTAPTISATTMGASACTAMFSGCTSLTTVQATLPATALADYCYASMFQSCTSLTTAPTLPATTLAVSCYDTMFKDCSSLTTAPTLPATTLADYCYMRMFWGCISLTAAPALPVEGNLPIGCYNRMFIGCTSLTRAPELPGDALLNTSYYGMFSGCTSLNYIVCYATDISATNCTKNWTVNVSSTGTFEISPTMWDEDTQTLIGWTRGVDGIPSGWIITFPDWYIPGGGGGGDVPDPDPDPEEEEW